MALAIVWIIIMLMVMQMLWQRSCPKCKKPVALRLKEKKLIDKREYQGSIWYHIKEIYKCDYCGEEIEDDIQEEGPRVSQD